MLLDIHIALGGPDHLRIVAPQERIGDHQHIRIEIFRAGDTGKIGCHLPDEEVSGNHDKGFSIAEERHESTPAEQMHVIIRVEGLGTDKIDKSVIYQVVLHCFESLSEANIRIFFKTEKWVNHPAFRVTIYHRKAHTFASETNTKQNS